MPRTSWPVSVIFVPCTGTTVPAGGTTLQRQWGAMSGDDGRNRRIASLAADLAKNPYRTLRRFGITPTEANLPDRVRQRVVVLSETAERARRLKQLLPTWEVLDMVPVEGEYAGWEREPAPDDAPPPGRISTLVYAARNRLRCDILIRATAGTGKLDWDWFRTPPALVVDLADRIETGKREHADVEARRREYREQGLKEVTVSVKPGKFRHHT